MNSEPWPWNSLEEPRPTDWGIGMTVCIAALCESREAIVAVSDHMLSTDDFSSDNLALKMDNLSEFWKVLFAANDLSSVVQVIEEAKRQIGPWDSEKDLEEITAIVQRAFLKEIERKIDSEVLHRYGLNRESFISSGLKKLGASLFRDLAQEIKSVSLDCQFLVYGFDSHGKGHIFTVGDPGKLEIWDTAGMCVIGSGKYMALSSLFFHSSGFLTPAPKAIYHACEAKFMAETSPGVGKKTFVSFLRKGHAECYLTGNEVAQIKDAWDSNGKPRIPSGIEDEIARMIKSAEKLIEESS
jgi:hypothetical protein